MSSEISPMKKHIIILITLLCFVLGGFQPSSGARFLENGLLIGSKNESVFDSNLNSVVAGAGFAPLNEQAEKNGVPCDKAHMKRRRGSAKNGTNERTKLMFRFQENGSPVDAKKEAAKPDKVVYNVFPKGRPRPSGSEPRRIAVVKGQRLSSSHHSPGVGHMQIYNTAKSRHAQQQTGVSKKRVLGSTPSPGDGH